MNQIGPNKQKRSIMIQVVDEDNMFNPSVYLVNGNVNEKVAPFPSELFSPHILPP
jgi:hypothetical protein